MVTTETVVPGTRSLMRTASSMAYSSKGLMAAAIPSRLSVPVTGSIWTLLVAGVCLMQTTMWMPIIEVVQLPLCELFHEPAEKIRTPQLGNKRPYLLYQTAA